MCLMIVTFLFANKREEYCLSLHMHQMQLQKCTHMHGQPQEHQQHCCCIVTVARKDPFHWNHQFSLPRA